MKNAIAFACDDAAQSALSEGLRAIENAEVTRGTLADAGARLANDGASPKLLIVDLDGSPYPAGAIYELAGLCNSATAVVALGSDSGARLSRSLLLAGVADYLVKPVKATAVAATAARVLGLVATGASERAGALLALAGTGGSGASACAAMLALEAAHGGSYVCVVDLSRTFATLAFYLDCEPGPGLAELLSESGRASEHPEMVDGVKSERGERIAVYAYPWGPEHAPAPAPWTVCELLVELQRQAHLVIVEGMSDSATRNAVLAMADRRAAVIEPTTGGAVAGTRLLATLERLAGDDEETIVVESRTRAFAGPPAQYGTEAEMALAYEPAVRTACDNGFREGRAPATLRPTITALMERAASARQHTPGTGPDPLEAVPKIARPNAITRLKRKLGSKRQASA